MESQIIITLIGGPTVLIELDGFRLLTDPTFDPPQEYSLAGAVYSTLEPPALEAERVLPVDAVLLSHDQHGDNLDDAGRALLDKVPRVFSTLAAASRLKRVEGLNSWSSTTLQKENHGELTITAVPARHGPIGIEPLTGDVTGFVVQANRPRAIYISGDTVWFSGVAQIATKFDIGLAILFCGAAQPRGPFNVTMDTNDAIEAAAAFKDAQVCAVHNRGWSHYKQSQQDLETAFQKVGLGNRIQRLTPGVPTLVSF